MKAILILEKHEHCIDCPLLDGEYDTCVVTGGYVEKMIRKEDRREIPCPLKPLPQKKEAKEIKHFNDFVYVKTEYDLITNDIVGKIKYDVETIFNEGYNSCVDEIIGDEK